MIKFRAWDKGTDLMNEVTVIDFESEEVYYHHWKYGHSEAINLKDIKLLQSTGLKDKHGVEIFEGDIVNVHEFINVGGIEGYEEGEREMIGIVKYGCIFNSPIPEWYLENSDDYIPFSYIDLHDESFEVLGNKYQHPHLLKE